MYKIIMKRLVFIVFLLSFCGVVGAQTIMSDNAVANFIQQEMRAGVSQAQIITKLVQRGVTIEQIRKVAKVYGRELRNGVPINEKETDAMSGQYGVNDDAFSVQDVNVGRVATQTDYEYADDSLSIYDFQLFMDNVDEKRVFGRNIFNNKRLSFEPNMNIATPQSYVLGPGDQVVINISGDSQRSMQLSVSPEGSITVPEYGLIYVSGMTVASANAKVKATIGSHYSGSEVKLSVGQTRTILVNVMGEVVTPGTYHLSAFSSVFHALYAAGGINELGTLRNVHVYRGGKLLTVVDIYEYILNGRLAGNVTLQDDDVIQVGPYDCLVEITGNVKRPMYYEMRSDESVSTLLKYSGGFTGDAYNKSIRLRRQNGDRYTVYNIGEFDLSSFHVADGDRVEVDAILDRYDNIVEVKGAVFRPGVYRLGDDVTSVRTLIEKADGLTEDAFAVRGVIRRLKEDRFYKTVPVDIVGIMNGTVADIPLMNEDVLFVPTVTDAQKQRVLTISGEVMNPGDYEYADNTAIEDLILQAGGLTDAASIAKVDVSRRIVDNTSTCSNQVLAETFTLDLKNGFVVGEHEKFVLEPYDVVYVRRSPGFQTPRNITVQGEVTFPGTYTLYKKNQRLSDAIKEAGGVSDDAFVKGARLERIMNEEERDRRDFLVKQLSRQMNDKDTFNISKIEMSNKYTVGIYLDKALEKPGSAYDVVLREGDVIIVPEYNATVKVSGDVMFPNTVSYMEGKKSHWYVNQSGGWGSRAKKSKMWVVYQNGTMAVGKKAKIEPGCEIIVPSKPQRNGMSWTQWLPIGSTVTSMAAMIATLVNVLKK